MYEQIDSTKYKETFTDANAPHLLLDVRTTEEFVEFRIPGAVNIPLDELPSRIDEMATLARDLPVVMVCRSGVRSMMAAQIARHAGLREMTIYNLLDGSLGWKKKGFPTDSGEPAT